MARKIEKDLSKGHVGKQLLLFAIPFIISNLVQALYSVADMIIVGQFAGTVSMSGVNIGGQVTMLITNIVFGITSGATIMIGQYMGAGNRKALKDCTGTLFSVLLIAAAILTGLMLALRTPILNAIQTPPPSFNDAKSYLLVTSLGTIFIFGYNALSAVMRGMGDSRSPLIFVTIACLVNVALDFLMVAYFQLGAFGAGLATIISQAISMILCILYLKKNDFVFDFNRKSFVIHKEHLRSILRIGLPMSVQNTCTSLSFLFLTAMVNILDPTAVASAAVGAVGKFNAFGVLPAFAMSAAISAMSAQNLGAGEEKRAVQTMKLGTLFALIMSSIVFLITVLFPEQIMLVFADDPALASAGREYLSSFRYDYLCVAIFAGFNGLFMGAGHTNFTLINGLMSSLLVRIPACYLFGIAFNMGLRGVGLGAPIASAASALLCFGYFLSGKWKKKRINTSLGKAQ
ncbi:MAG: MATE family efflux transporter [Clostridia bacterium]|nr:MATE family efflux transporter [Clostridia bacterium]